MRPKRLSQNPRLALAVIVGALFLLQSLTLACAPLNPDGAELLVTSIFGGVLHPPGYPLLAWLSRLFIHLPFGQPATRLALLSLLANSGAAWFLGSLLALLGCGLAAQLVGVVAFALFPAVWFMAIQPEKYALTALFMSALLYVTLRALARRPFKIARGDWLELGALSGLALSTHTITVLAIAPAAATLVAGCIVRKRRWLTEAAMAALLALGLAVVFYLSLLLLHSDAAYPDWGKLRSVADVARHALRLDFNPLGLSPYSNGDFTALSVFFSQAARAWHLQFVLLVLGALLLYRSGKRFELALVGASFAAGLLFLSISQIGSEFLVSAGYLERYAVLAVLPGAVLIGLGFQELATRARRWKSAPSAAAFALSALAVVQGFSVADASHDDTFDVYRRVLSFQMPRDAFYVGGGDLDGFWGVETSAGRLRFPLSGNNAWFIERALPLVEPRVAQMPRPPRSIDDIMQWAYARGDAVVSTDRAFIEASGHGSQSRGLLWVMQKRIKPGFGPESVAAALKLCSTLDMVDHPLPREGHYWSQYLWKLLRQSLFGAIAQLEETHQTAAARAAKELGQALSDGRDPQAWHGACSRLTECAAHSPTCGSLNR